MIYIVANAVPIIIASLASLGIAALWYRRSAKIGALVTLFAALLWLNAILAGALILAPPKGGIWVMTLGSAFVIWIGFILPAIVAGYRLRSVAWATIVRDTSYWLAAMLAAAALMRTIGLTLPPS